MPRPYQIIVVGAGHAGCEAARACARLGLRTAMVTMNIDLIAPAPDSGYRLRRRFKDRAGGIIDLSSLSFRGASADSVAQSAAAFSTTVGKSAKIEGRT